jgi:NAD+ synthase
MLDRLDLVKETEHVINWIKDYFVNNGNKNTKAIIGISGGKDSTVAAALCVKALGADRVLGVLMPQGEQKDIDDARRVCEILNITSIEINIENTCAELYQALDKGIYKDINETVVYNKAVTTNLPARIRMTTLYAVAAECGGRVCNTCNYSENYIGYSTKYGDHAGDFAPLHQYTVSEVIEIGKILDLPHELLYKAPADGLTGSTDEDNLGFTYKTLDKYLLEDVVPDFDTYRNIMERYQRNKHKLIYMPICTRKNSIIHNYLKGSK